jgi:hypothetical protein
MVSPERLYQQARRRSAVTKQSAAFTAVAYPDDPDYDTGYTLLVGSVALGSSELAGDNSKRLDIPLNLADRSGPMRDSERERT